VSLLLSLLLNRLGIAIVAHRGIAYFTARKLPEIRLEIAVPRELKNWTGG